MCILLHVNCFSLRSMLVCCWFLSILAVVSQRTRFRLWLHHFFLCDPGKSFSVPWFPYFQNGDNKKVSTARIIVKIKWDHGFESTTVHKITAQKKVTIIIMSLLMKDLQRTCLIQSQVNTYAILHLKLVSCHRRFQQKASYGIVVLIKKQWL